MTLYSKKDRKELAGIMLQKMDRLDFPLLITDIHRAVRNDFRFATYSRVLSLAILMTKKNILKTSTEGKRLRYMLNMELEHALGRLGFLEEVKPHKPKPRKVIPQAESRPTGNLSLEDKIKTLIDEEVSKKTMILYEKYQLLAIQLSDKDKLFTQAIRDKEYFENLAKEKQKQIDSFNSDKGFLKTMFGGK